MKLSETNKMKLNMVTLHVEDVEEEKPIQHRMERR